MKRYCIVLACALVACTEAPQVPQTDTDMAWQLCSLQTVDTQLGRSSAVQAALANEQRHCKAGN